MNKKNVLADVLKESQCARCHRPWLGGFMGVEYCNKCLENEQTAVDLLEDEMRQNHEDRT